MPARLSSEHHAIIQGLLSQGPLQENLFFSLFAQVTGISPGNNQEVFNRFLLDINEELAFVQFELQACRNQYNGKVYYGVVNNVSDECSTKIGTKYRPHQIAFYKGIIEAIVQDPEGKGTISGASILYLNLLNQFFTEMGSESQGWSSQIPSAIKKFSVVQKEKTLQDLVRDQWLCSTPDGRIGLGVRSFLDLRSWFHSNEFPTCEVCNEAAVKAECCRNEVCHVRIHDYCLKTKFSQQKVNRVCSGCGTVWDPFANAELVEEEDDTNSSSQNEQTPEQPALRKRKRPRASRQEASPHTPALRTRKKSRASRQEASPHTPALRTRKRSRDSKEEARPHTRGAASVSLSETRRSARISARLSAAKGVCRACVCCST